MWEIESNQDDEGKNRYMFYTGREDREMRDILIKIINSEWNTLPTDCEKLVKQLRK